MQTKISEFNINEKIYFWTTTLNLDTKLVIQVERKGLIKKPY